MRSLWFGDYATTVVDEVNWLVSAARSGDSAHILPGLDDPFFAPMLDYTAEDRSRAGRVRGESGPLD